MTTLEQCRNCKHHHGMDETGYARCGYWGVPEVRLVAENIHGVKWVWCPNDPDCTSEIKNAKEKFLRKIMPH